MIQVTDRDRCSHTPSDSLTSDDKLRRPEQALRHYGWSRRDVRLFMQTFAQEGAPFWLSPPGRKDYVQPFFLHPRTKKRTARGLKSTDVRKHLLGKVLVAPPPNRCPTVIQLDLDAHDGNWQRVHQILERLRVLRLRYMLEESTGGAHVSIRLGNRGCGVTARRLQQVTEQLLKNQGWSGQRGELTDAVRVDTARGLRLPFAESMVVSFSHTPQSFTIYDPGIARTAWDVFLTLPIHRFSTLERRASRVRKPVGRPRRTPPLSTPFLSIRGKGQERSNRFLRGAAQVKQRSGNKLQLSLPRNNPAGALAEIQEKLPSARGLRHKCSPDVVGAALRAGYDARQTEEITWDWLRSCGSEDALTQPEWAKQQLRRVIDYFQATHRPGARRRSA